MKKIWFFVCLLCMLTAFADNKLKTRINVFLKNGDVEMLNSSVISGAGLTTTSSDGNEHNRFVAHYFSIGPDSILSFPLEEIDSITFGNNIKFRPKNTSFEIDEDVIKYIISWDGEVISFSKEIPSSKLPSVGNHIYRVVCDEMFPTGLCACVNSVTDNGEFVNVRVTEIFPDLVFDEFIIEASFDETAESDGTDVDFNIDEENESLSRANAVSGVRRGSMMGHISVGSSVLHYNVLNGNLFGKFIVTVDGKYKMDCKGSDVDKTFIGQEYAIPHSLSQKASRLLNPSASVSMIMTEKAVSENVSLELEHKYSAAVYVAIANGDTVIYSPELNTLKEPVLRSNSDAYLDGSISYTANVALELHPIFSNMGIKAMLTSGPTISCSLGYDRLNSMSEDYMDELYEKSSFKILTAMPSVRGLTTTYKGNKMVGSQVMKQKGKMKPIVSLDGEYFIFPKINEMKSEEIDGEGIHFTATSRMNLLYPMNVGYEVFNVLTSDVIRQQPDINKFSVFPDPKNIFSADIPFGSDLSESNAINYSTRILVRYADILVKGPDSGSDICTLDGGIHPHAIDLGLPSGTKWACCNVGAEDPEDFGDKFQQFSPFHNAIWGEEWQMPTLTQIYELVKKCSWEFTRRKGVIGWIGTGPNGNTIFLPASGYISDDGKNRYDTDECSVFWSSSRMGNLGMRIYFVKAEDIELVNPLGIVQPELIMYPDDESPKYYGALRLVTNY